MSRILITGTTGFVGSHLAEHILNLQEEHEVYGLCRWRSNRENLKSCINQIKLVEGDLLDFSSLIRVLGKSKPDIIFHLAAQSYVKTSFTSPIDTLQRNVIGTCNLLEAVRFRHTIGEIDPVIQIASSSEVYGEVLKEDQPTNELTPLKPVSPYAVSKVAEDMLGYQYHQSYGIKILRTRLFSHSGARRGDVFVLSAFAKQIVGIELGLLKEMKVGNLYSSRTFMDVRDAVRAYWLLVTKVKDYGEVFNIGGDKEITIRHILKKLLELSDLGVEFDRVSIDKKLIRLSDVTTQIPDSSKFRKLTGWEPLYSIDDTLYSILTYWREELKINPWKIKSIAY